MCDLDLNTQADTKAWLLANHPDKNKNTPTDVDTFAGVVNCYKERQFCLGDVPPGPPASKRTSSKKPSASALPSALPSAEGVVGDVPPREVPLDKAKRDKIYTCMRQTENWSKILPQHKLDNRNFNPDEVKLAIHNASPKLEQLFRIIDQVDENDMRTHGQFFKHFIFSDIKEEGYGAKILASAFIANGYKNLITARSVPGQKALKLTLLPTGTDGRNKAFGLLSSSTIFNSEFNQRFKKEVLTLYNKRPDNIQGEEMRFIILDSGFKEGIDLFDVKYVHIFEPSMTVADLKQTIGRATRTCGQKGLNFEPNVGWPLFVYNYYIAIPEDMKDSYEVTDPSLLRYPEEDTMLFQRANKLKDATILYSGFDKTLTNLAEQLYKLAPIFSVDFELTKHIHRIDDMTYLYEQQQASVDTASNSASSAVGGALKDKPKMNCSGKCGLRSTNDIPATVGFLYRVYAKYGHNRKAVPSKNVRSYLCAYMKSHPEYCDQVNKEWGGRAASVPYLLEKSLETKNKPSASYMTLKPVTVKPASATPYLDIGTATSPKTVAPNASYMTLKPATVNPMTVKPATVKPANATTYLDIIPEKPPSYMEVKPSSATPYLEIGSTKRSSTKRSTKSTKRSTKRSTKSTKRSSKRSSQTKSTLKLANEVMQQLELVPYVEPTNQIDYSIVEYTGKIDSQIKQSKAGPPPKKLNFQKMRDFIKTNYVKNFTWGEIVVENKCVQPEQVKAQAAQVQAAQTQRDKLSAEQGQTQQGQTQQGQTQQVGGASRIMSLNPTQDFVRTFFTPQSPYKGLLLFHSVGTGKTCSAIATATASFEQEGYTILWVTRTTLKSDVYKNMFDDVCHLILAEKMKQGLVMPEDLTRRKKLLSKNWIEPISYKTFSNLLTPGGHNEYMDRLIQRNGTTDILKKTLIIIDEAHKLYGGDLKAGERPDMAVMERLLQKSYDVSGKDSAKLLIMTATPFTNSPMELFQLINLCKETPSEHIETDLRTFRRNYMNADSLLTDAGVKKLADKLCGYISYLNREQDPTQFAQPIMIEVPVIMSHIGDNVLRKELFNQQDKQVKTLNKLEAKALTKQEETNIKELNNRLRGTQKTLKALLKERQMRCKTIKNRADKARCMQEIEEEVEAEMNDTVAIIKEELERLKRSQLENKGLKEADKERVAALKERLETLRNDLLQEVMLVERCKNIKLV